MSRAVLDQSPAEGVPLPSKEVARDRVLNDNELAHVILAARKIGGPYDGIVELLALTGQRREEVARLQWPELDLAQRVWTLPKSRTKNAKAYVVRRRLLAKLTNRRLKRGVFRSVAELQVAIDRFIAEIDADPKTLRVDRTSKPHPRRCQTWEANVRVIRRVRTIQ